MSQCLEVLRQVFYLRARPETVTWKSADLPEPVIIPAVPVVIPPVVPPPIVLGRS